jgi:hypothetical protein
MTTHHAVVVVNKEALQVEMEPRLSVRRMKTTLYSKGGGADDMSELTLYPTLIE